MAATVKILLDEQQEFYVPDDIILGRVLLTLEDPSYSFKELTVKLWCVEFYDTKILGKHKQASLFVPAKENWTALLKAYNANKRGQLECKFSIVLDYKHIPSYPPSFSFKTSDGGVDWRVVAEAHLEKTDTVCKAQTVWDTYLIDLYPDAIIHPRIHELAGFTSLAFDKCHCDMNYYLPQGPDKFTVRLEFIVPQEVQCGLKIRLRRKTFILEIFKADVITEDITTTEIPKVKISNKSRPIEVNCQLEKREPAAFSSGMFIVQYTVHIDLTSDHFKWYREVPVDIIPPAPQSRASYRQLLVMDERSSTDPPPPYSD